MSKNKKTQSRAVPDSSAGAHRSRRRFGWQVWLALGLLVIILAVFLYEFASFDPAPEHATSGDIQPTVEALLANADPERGARHVETFVCMNCHFSGQGNTIAPPFEGIAERASERKAELSAPAYLYESIINPLAYVAPHYAPSMPQNFRDRLTDEQLGDIIAYLLTQ